jgi:hypothetical protein
MLLADANGPGGSGWEYVNPTATPSASPTSMPLPTDEPLPTTATGSSEIPSFEHGSVDTGPNYSLFVMGILIVAVLGTIITLYLRNRK